MEKKIKVRSDVPKEPALVIENQLLLKPGVWKGVPLTAEEIRKGVENNTNWSDKRNYSVYYGHDPKKTENWVGVYENRRYLTLKDGVDTEGFYGDLKIYDSNLASKLAYGGAKMAVSQGMDYVWGRTGPYDLKFNHLGIVHDPGCKDDRLFLNLDSEGENEEGKKYTAEFRAQINLDSDSNENTVEKGEKKMTDDNVTSNVTLDSEEVKKIVEQTLSEREEKAKAEAEKKAAEEAKKAEEEKKAAEEADKKAAEEAKAKEEAAKVAEEAAKKVVDSGSKDSISKEDLDALNKKIDEVFNQIKEKATPSEPQTSAQPKPSYNGNESQAEIAKKLVKGLSR